MCWRARIGFGVRGTGLARVLEQAQAKPRQLLDRGKIGALRGIAQRDRHARSAGARRPSDAMHVDLRLVRNIEIDDMGDAVDVDAARGDVGRDQDRHAAESEFGERALARRLRLVAVDRFGADARARQALGDAIGAVLGPREDERTRHRGVAEEARENTGLLRGGDEHDVLIDALDWRRRRGDRNANRLAQDAGRKAFDAAGHRRGEEQGLTLLRQQRDDPAHVGQKAHVEHAVGLVEDQDRKPVEAHDPLRREIEQAAGRCDENVCAAPQRVDLRPLPDAAVDDGRAERKVAAIGAETVGNLDRELSRRNEDERARRRKRLVGAMLGKSVQNRQRKRGGLAGSGLREADDVTARQQGRDRLGLDWGGSEVVLGRECAQKRLCEA
jgi:hypothetical protein